MSKVAEHPCHIKGAVATDCVKSSAGENPRVDAVFVDTLCRNQLVVLVNHFILIIILVSNLIDFMS